MTLWEREAWDWLRAGLAVLLICLLVAGMARCIGQRVEVVGECAKAGGVLVEGQRGLVCIDRKALIP